LVLFFRKPDKPSHRFSWAAAASERIAFGSTRPIVAALGKRGHAVNDRVYKVRFDGTAICSNNSERLSDSEMARQAIEIAQNGLEIRLGTKFLSQPASAKKWRESAAKLLK